MQFCKLLLSVNQNPVTLLYLLLTMTSTHWGDNHVLACVTKGLATKRVFHILVTHKLKQEKNIDEGGVVGRASEGTSPPVSSILLISLQSRAARLRKSSLYVNASYAGLLLLSGKLEKKAKKIKSKGIHEQILLILMLTHRYLF